MTHHRDPGEFSPEVGTPLHREAALSGPAGYTVHSVTTNMRAVFVLLLIGGAVLALVGGSALHRETRQSWGFPQEQSTSERFPVRPPSRLTTTTTTTAATNAGSTASTARPGVSTTTQPAGVVFQVKNCPCQAPPQFNPVCGTDSNTYVNRQKLMCARQCGFDVQEARMGAC